MSMIQVRHSTEVEIPEATATRLLTQLLGHAAQDLGQPAAAGPTNSHFLKARRFSAGEVCRWFGIPEKTDVPRIGQAWPGQGGVYAGVMRGQGGKPDYHLIVPTNPAAYIDKIKWGPTGHSVAGAASEWDGQANTEALARDTREHPAADWVSNLDIDGHSDLYLPARREQRLMWVNVPELFEDGWYWSSTQSSAGTAWIQYFVDGIQTFIVKGTDDRARAVRRLII